MTDFRSLDPETRAFALVGRFLHQWSTMEAIMHDCIQTAFNLTPMMKDILCANLSLQNKLNIVRTIIDVTGADKSTFNKLMRRIGNYSHRRNTVAHEAFKADLMGTGVKFTAVKAKGEYDPRPITWSVKRFDEEFRLLEGIKVRLLELKAHIQANPIKDRILPSPLSADFGIQDDYAAWPMMRTMSPVLMDYLARQAPTRLDSDPATLEKNSQTPERPHEKQ